jgi:hypothetical protein
MTWPVSVALQTRQDWLKVISLFCLKDASKLEQFSAI